MTSETTGDESEFDGAPENDGHSAAVTGRRRPGRTGLSAAALALLVACGGLMLYGVQGGGGTQEAASPRTPGAAAVTYEVTGTGTADLTFQARSESGTATVVKGARLPWRTTVEVPAGRDPLIGIVLGEDGGTARCSLAIGDRHVRSATATGAFGRATCAGGEGGGTRAGAPPEAPTLEP